MDSNISNDKSFLKMRNTIAISITFLFLSIIFLKAYKKSSQINPIKSNSFIDIKTNTSYNTKSKYNDININEKLIIGIDFGSINSGYSYLNGKDISKIINSRKTPTEIELSRESKQGIKYSYKASTSLMNYRQEELNKINFIKNFKHNVEYIYPNEKDIDKLNIIKQYFALMKKVILEEIEHNINQKVNEKNIKWIFSIPASWTIFQRQVIKNSTIESGMYNIEFIYESEAASLSMYYDKFIPNNLKQLKKNDKNIFMLLDAGGCTIDISLYEIIDNTGTMKEIFPTQSFFGGVQDISTKIIDILKKIIKKNKLEQMKNENPGNWLKMLRDIIKAIENTYSIDGKEIFEIRGNFEQKGENYIDYIIDEKDGKKYRINYEKPIIYFPSDLIGKIIEDNTNVIMHKIENYLKLFKVNSIMVTGGFSKNKIFRSKLEKDFNMINIEYLSSNDNVISKGSVIYSIHPFQIKSRKSTVTIGIQKNKDNDINFLVKKGEEIRNNSLVKYIKPNLQNQEYIDIYIYINDEENFTQFKKTDKVGKIVLKLNSSNMNIIIVKFNYNLIISFYAYYQNGEEIEGNLELEY